LERIATTFGERKPEIGEYVLLTGELPLENNDCRRDWKP
jgi:hypothetical protein